MCTMYRLLRFSAVALVSSLLLLAQLNRGSLTGTVTDNSGAVIPNVKLTIRNIATGAQYETVTNENGQYNEANLPIGEYVIVFESPNFKRVERKGVDLGVTQVLRVDATLEVGSVTESVSVTAETPRLQTDSPEVGTSLSNKQLIDLPLTFAGARIAENFAYLVTPVYRATHGPAISTAVPASRKSRCSTEPLSQPTSRATSASQAFRWKPFRSSRSRPAACPPSSDAPKRVSSTTL